MKPLRLHLKGFAGISSGLQKPEITLDLTVIPESARLVVLSGHNGAGKSTILDNLHPYRLMPSRCKGIRPSAFSYWDELCAPVAQKQLDWEYQGVTYRSDILFKSSGKTRSQTAYLHQKVGSDWKPVKLADGSLSDGSVASYDRCVDQILGRPEVFFTTAFSAWKRQMLGDYVTGDIKTLLSAWLGHDDLLLRSSQAAEVVSQLKASLAECQSKLRDAERLEAAVAQTSADEARLTEQLIGRQGELERAEALVVEARNVVIRLDARIDGMRQIEAQRSELRQHIETERKRHAEKADEIRRQCSAEIDRQRQQERECSDAAVRVEKEIGQLQTQLHRVDQRLASEARVLEAQKQLPALQARRSELLKSIDALQKDISALRPQRAVAMKESTALATVEADGRAAVERKTSLEVVASLAERVPCVGSSFQPKCELLQDALTARSQLQAVVAEVLKHKNSYRSHREILRVAGLDVAKLDRFEKNEAGLREALDSVGKSIDDLAPVIAQAPLILEAREQRPGLVASNAEKQQHQLDLVARRAACGKAIAEAESEQNRRLQLAQEDLARAVSGFEVRLAALPAAIGEQERVAAAQALSVAEQKVQRLKNDLVTLRTSHAASVQHVAQAKLLLSQIQPYRKAAELLGAEVAAWELTALGIGKNGLVAFSIDDAGPEISSVANELIVKCYDGNFVVRFETQPELRSGAAREGFEIMVRDTQGGDEKSIDRLSGGQEVFVNDCLTRGVALYLAQCARYSYDTLFSDETDGPLDEEKKRQFIRMKRNVLSMGNYSREFFVSQSREVQGLADYVIDVTAL